MEKFDKPITEHIDEIFNEVFGGKTDPAKAPLDVVGVGVPVRRAEAPAPPPEADQTTPNKKTTEKHEVLSTPTARVSAASPDAGSANHGACLSAPCSARDGGLPAMGAEDDLHSLVDGFAAAAVAEVRVERACFEPAPAATEGAVRIKAGVSERERTFPESLLKTTADGEVPDVRGAVTQRMMRELSTEAKDVEAEVDA